MQTSYATATAFYYSRIYRRKISFMKTVAASWAIDDNSLPEANILVTVQGL
jgi:hypothetical protein